MSGVWARISGRAGRNDYPFLLATAVLMDGTLTDVDEIAEALAEAWTSAEYPESSVEQIVWQTIFGLTGFVEDGKRMAVPVTAPLTLYRGAVDKRKTGMSWTADLEKARWFAGRFAKAFGTGQVWQITVDPESILGHFADRREDEWVLAMDEELEELIVPHRG